MFVFGRRSTANLAECHRDLRTLFSEVIKWIDCAAIDGERGEAEQETAFAQGRSKVHWPNSKHNVDGVKRKTAWAVDVVPYPVDWKDRKRFERFAAFVLATAERLRDEGLMAHAVRNGGDWDRDGVFDDWDMPHFELLGVADGE